MTTLLCSYACAVLRRASVIYDSNTLATCFATLSPPQNSIWRQQKHYWWPMGVREPYPFQKISHYKCQSFRQNYIKQLCKYHVNMTIFCAVWRFFFAIVQRTVSDLLKDSNPLGLEWKSPGSRSSLKNCRRWGSNRCPLAWELGTSYRNFHINEFVANALHDNIA